MSRDDCDHGCGKPDGHPGRCECEGCGRRANRYLPSDHGGSPQGAERDADG